MKLRPIAVFVAALFGLVACTTHEIVTVQAENDPETRDLPLGGACRADEQCVAGLTCKLFMSEGDICVDRCGCTTACSSDAMCRAFDPRALCAAGCNGERICIVTEFKAADSDLPIGALCKATTECAEGLKCLRGAGGAELCDEKRTCSISCTSDDDCVELDESAKCFEGCSGKSICMLTAAE